MWDALTGDELHSFEHKHIVRTCAFSEVSFWYPMLEVCKTRDVLEILHHSFASEVV